MYTTGTALFVLAIQRACSHPGRCCYASEKVQNIFETKEDFEEKRKNTHLHRTSFEGVGAICRLWGRLSPQVGEINARKFAMGRNMA